ncbi:hypothetical protein UFOVP1309_75 [uncultured Caudovirales phage]|uniref:Uncharacterized protein n=1 Tax=uncultured Caudovirales phage TaxID=2100421 RepID=A0A6J5S0J7_9CAUD|nr:hypothetical protein UFOVP1309_75 [uncultured Caudovirales phage]
MAQTNHSKTFGKAIRRPGTVDRHDYLQGAMANAKRGQELPHTKLLDIDVVTIRSAKRQRESLLKYIRENLGNTALAKQFGVHQRTIEKVLSYEAHGDVA